MSNFGTSKMGLAGAFLALLPLLGMAPQTASSMYLRIENMHAAPAVSGLSYDAVATVPQRPNTPAALLPADQVIGSMVVPADTKPRLDRSTFKGVTTFTVVAVNADGVVVERTSFTGVSIHAVVPVKAPGSGKRIEFGAQAVVVSTPHGT